MGATRTALYDTAALAARIGAAAAATVPAFAYPAVAAAGLPAPAAQLPAYLGITSATALALGLAAPLAGTVLAVLLVGALGAAPLDDGALAAAVAHRDLLVLALVCVLLAVNPGRLTLDRWLFGRQRGPKRSQHAAARSTTAKRPEHAPPLPYSEEQVSVRRTPLPPGGRPSRAADLQT